MLFYGFSFLLPELQNKVNSTQLSKTNSIEILKNEKKNIENSCCIADH